MKKKTHTPTQKKILKESNDIWNNVKMFEGKQKNFGR